MKMTVRKALAATLAVFGVALVTSAIAGEPAAGQESSKSRASRVASPASPKSLEEFLSRALRNHPDILAAEAKLESVQAELTRARFEITRELITLWNERKAQSESVQHLEMIRERSGSTAVVRDLIEAKGKAAETDAQVSYLLGQMGGAAAREPVAAGGAESKRLPQGPQVERVLEELNSLTELQFIETPIWDVAETLSDFHDFLFVRDPLLPDVPVTMDVKGIPLGAAFQALEDVTPGVRFVVCDYGILVTSDDSEAAATYISANEFWREQLPQQTTGQDPTKAVKVREGTISPLFAPPKPDASKGAPSADPFAPPKPRTRGSAF